MTGAPCGVRATLRGPATLKCRPAVIEYVQLRWVVVDPGNLVANEGIVLPAVPESANHSDEFGGAVVAHVVAWCGIAVEIPRFHVGDGRHDVPARASAADVIERGEFPGDVIGLVVGRRG